MSILFDRELIDRHAVRATLARIALNKRGSKVQNVAIAVGDGIVGVGNTKSGNFYYSYGIEDRSGAPLSAAKIVERFNLISLARVQGIPLVTVGVRSA